MAFKKSSKGRFSSSHQKFKQHTPNIKVIHKNSTPRDNLQEKLVSGHLSITLKVPPGFYLRIGSGEDLELIDAALIQSVLNRTDLNQIKSRLEMTEIAQQSRVLNKVVIPASSLKGAIRFRAEQSFVATQKVNACYVVRSSPPVTQKSWRHKKAYGVNQPRYSCRDFRNPCVVCNIFGMMGLRGKIFFTDAELVDGSIETLQLKVRHGRTSREEAVKPGSIFYFQIYFENFSEDELGLLFFVMNLDNNHPILLGRHKYAIQKTNGKKIKFGHVILTLNKIIVYQGINEKKIGDIKEFVQAKIKVMQQVYGSAIKKLHDWEVLPC
ncbi:MAG: RAMP superfamily CRISPR-associated protein [Candidatus Helarchaeota archaeon]